MLGNIKDCHDDISCVCDDGHSHKGLEDPLEKVERFKIVHVVAVDDHLDQLIGHDKGQDDARNGDNNILRQVAHHVEHAAIPCLRCCADRASDLADLAVDTVEKAGKVAHDAAYQQVFEPFNKPFPEKIQMDIPPSSDTSRVMREVLVRLGVQSAAMIEAAGSSVSSVFRA